MQKKPANASDFPAIAICFSDSEVAFLFAELIEAEGFPTSIAEDATSIVNETYIVTESSILEQICIPSKGHCLVITDTNASIPQGVIPLTRPLSEGKINQALRQFLPMEPLDRSE